MTTTVLVIDHDEDVRATLRAVLDDVGHYHVMEAADGESGLALMRLCPQGVVVLFDYLMEPGDGEAILESALGDPVLSERHTFVCMTVMSPTRIPSTLLELMARHDIARVWKPFDIDDLLAAIHQAEQRLAVLPAWVEGSRQPTM